MHGWWQMTQTFGGRGAEMLHNGNKCGINVYEEMNCDVVNRMTGSLSIYGRVARQACGERQKSPIITWSCRQFIFFFFCSSSPVLWSGKRMMSGGVYARGRRLDLVQLGSGAHQRTAGVRFLRHVCIVIMVKICRLLSCAKRENKKNNAFCKETFLQADHSTLNQGALTTTTHVYGYGEDGLISRRAASIGFFREEE